MVGSRWFSSHPGAPVDPVSVVGSPPPSHFHIEILPCGGVSRHSEATSARLKYPAVSVVKPPIFIGDPLGSVVWMTASCPRKEHRKEVCLNLPKDLVARRCCEVCAPADDLWVQDFDEVFLVHTAMSA